MLKKNPPLCFLIALISMVPVGIAEYRRIAFGIFDITYWLLGATMIIAVFALYQVFGPMYMENYEKMTEAERKKKKLDPSTVKSNAISMSLMIPAFVALLIGAVIGAIV